MKKNCYNIQNRWLDFRKRIDESFANLKERDICFENFKNEKKWAKTNIGCVKKDDINHICKLIIRANSNIVIEKICYREDEGLLTFYAKRKLDISFYKEKSKNFVAKSGKNSVNNYLFSAFSNCSEIKGYEVSLKDISVLYYEKAQEFDLKLQTIKASINLIVNSKGKFSFCNLVNFNYSSNVLTLGFDRKVKYRFKICDNKIESLNEDLLYLEDDIWTLYDLYKDYACFMQTEINNLASTNTKFFVNFNSFGFSAFLTDADKLLFSINFDAFSNYFSYNCKYILDQLKMFVDSNYIDFLNYIYVSIDDLPIWLQKEVLKNKNTLLGSSKGFLEGAKKLLQRIRNIF